MRVLGLPCVHIHVQRTYKGSCDSRIFLWRVVLYLFSFSSEKERLSANSCSHYVPLIFSKLRRSAAHGGPAVCVYPLELFAKRDSANGKGSYKDRYVACILRLF